MSSKSTPGTTQSARTGQKVKVIVKTKYDPNIIAFMKENKGRFDKNTKTWTVYTNDPENLQKTIKSYDPNAEIQVITEKTVEKGKTMYVRAGKVYLRKSKSGKTYSLRITLRVFKEDLEKLLSGEKDYAAFNIVVKRREK